MTGHGESIVTSVSQNPEPNYNSPINKRQQPSHMIDGFFNVNYKLATKDFKSKNRSLNTDPITENDEAITQRDEIQDKMLTLYSSKELEKRESNASSPLNLKFSEKEDLTLSDGKQKNDTTLNSSGLSSQVPDKMSRSGSLKRPSVGRKKTSDHFLHLREDSLTISINSINHYNLSSPSTPTTPRLSTTSNNYSPQQHQRTSRPPFFASKHAQIIPVLSVNDLSPTTGGPNTNINNINMTAMVTQTPGGSVYSRSARNSVINIVHTTKEESGAKLIYPSIDENALKEYHEATKHSEVEVIDYKNKERKTLKLKDGRDADLVRQLTNITKNNGSAGDIPKLSTQRATDLKGSISKPDNLHSYSDEEDKSDDNYAETIIDGHTNFTIAYNMLSGIKTSLTNHQEKVEKKLGMQRAKGNKGELVDIKERDFTNTEKLKFVHKNRLLYSFKFKDYAPQVFSNLRKIFKIDDKQYLESLTSKHVLSELNSPGKSGSFFYYSPDNKYIIKTIRRAEHKHLRKHLKQYYEHCEGNPETFLSQFYGLYRIKLPISLKFTNPPKSRRIYFIVMNNVFPMHIDQSFDLKGSLLGRITTLPASNIPLRQRSFSTTSKINNAKSHSVVQPLEDKNLAQVSDKDSGDESSVPLTLKDLNWLNNSMRLELDATTAQHLKVQLNRDVSLLKRLNTMDYSLLIGIHFANPQEFYYSDDLVSKSIASKDGSKLYFIGIIDCLTNYSFLKKAETLIKSITYSKDEISAVPPDMYGKRFITFMEQNVLRQEESPRDDGSELKRS